MRIEELPPPRRTLDPILSLRVSGEQKSVISSLCFLATAPDSDDDDFPPLRCQTLVSGERRHDQDLTSSSRQSYDALNLQSRRLVSCHANGDVLLWNLASRKPERAFTPNRGPGLLLRRLDDGSILYQSRDPEGTISLHDPDSAQQTHSFPSYSTTFCAAATDGRHLVAAPCADYQRVQVRDWRVSSQVLLDMPATDQERQGMLTSLSLVSNLLVCGMEGGAVAVYDLRKSSEALTVKASTSIAVSKDPILALDSRVSESGSVWTVAGIATNKTTVNDVETDSIAVLKASATEQEELTCRVRLRLPTSIGDGKTGVNLCRFRPDGAIYAVAGWDQRLRIFHRKARKKEEAPLAILKGHSASVTAIDWAGDSSKSGYLATGAEDGRIFVWRCFSQAG